MSRRQLSRRSRPRLTRPGPDKRRPKSDIAVSSAIALRSPRLASRCAAKRLKIACSRTEFHRLNPERDPIAYVRGSSMKKAAAANLDLPSHPLAKRDQHPHAPTASAKRTQSEAMARRYIQENFEASDWLAVVVRNRETGETVQRITTAQRIASPDFQSWLRHKNAHGSDIYLSLNTLKEHARGRTKADVKEIRHLYLDLDEEGQQKLAAIYQNPAVPHPNYVLQTSPDKFQVIWRVRGSSTKRGRRASPQPGAAVWRRSGRD